MVKIFSVERSGLSYTLLIDKGAKDGVQKSTAVVAGGNILAGVIGEVFYNSSRVILLNDMRSSISVRIGNSDIIGEAKGVSSDKKIALDFVTNQDLVQEGDLVLSNGLDNLPESLILGHISKVELKGGSLFKKVEADIMFDLSMGPNLFVILKQ
jgi:rod shape-determining protein MreC